MDFAISRNGVKVRLTYKAWMHIVTVHNELLVYRDHVLYTVENPDDLFTGSKGEYIALTTLERGKHLVVVYGETGPTDGFVITAFIERNRRRLIRELEQLWP